MLSSLKKPSDKTNLGVPAWHPNFRIADRLPDTKAVRTSFFVNALAVFVVVSLALFVGYREYELKVVGGETARALEAIQKSKPTSDRAVTLYKNFLEEEKKVKELQQFLAASKLIVSDFVLLVGDALPPAVIITSIDCRPDAVSLRGSIEGPPDEASGRAVAYVESLRQNTSFQKYFGTMTLTNIVRDPGTGRMQFVIDLTIKK